MENKQAAMIVVAHFTKYASTNLSMQKSVRMPDVTPTVKSHRNRWIKKLKKFLKRNNMIIMMSTIEYSSSLQT